MAEYTLELRSQFCVEHKDFKHMPTLEEIIRTASDFGHPTVFYQGTVFNTRTGETIS